jgi:hypothetical protein
MLPYLWLMLASDALVYSERASVMSADMQSYDSCVTNTQDKCKLLFHGYGVLVHFQRA